MNTTEVLIYEQARRFANHAVWTISLQVNRLQRVEPEDQDFIFRDWADFHFLIISLTKLRKAGLLALKSDSVKPKIQKALERFDYHLPYIQTLRNVDQHFNDYAIDEGNNKSIKKESLEVGMCNNQVWHWLGYEVDIIKAKKESILFFKAIQDSRRLLKK